MEINKISLMKKAILPLGIILLLANSCNRYKNNYDATGIFEAEEIIISSEVSGKIIELNLEEGSTLEKDSIVAKIDPLQYELQKQQIEASLSAIGNKNIPVFPQIKILESQIKAQQEQIKTLQVQLNTARKEKDRIAKLVKGDALPGKQLDDINAQIDYITQQIKSAEEFIAVTNQQMISQREIVSAQNSGINSEKEPLNKRREQAMDILSKTNIVNPIKGTVLAKYVNQYEIVAPGKPIYKIAPLTTLKLRAYISGSQLAHIKIQQSVKVHIQLESNEVKEYQGQIVWISDKAEFTPKTIQTKEERINLVYPIKILVNNDGLIKIGMYGDVKF